MVGSGDAPGSEQSETKSRELANVCFDQRDDDERHQSRAGGRADRVSAGTAAADELPAAAPIRLWGSARHGACAYGLPDRGARHTGHSARPYGLSDGCTRHTRHTRHSCPYAYPDRGTRHTRHGACEHQLPSGGSDCRSRGSAAAYGFGKLCRSTGRQTRGVGPCM